MNNQDENDKDIILRWFLTTAFSVHSYYSSSSEEANSRGGPMCELCYGRRRTPTRRVEIDINIIALSFFRSHDWHGRHKIFSHTQFELIIISDILRSTQGSVEVTAHYNHFRIWKFSRYPISINKQRHSVKSTLYFRILINVCTTRSKQAAMTNIQVVNTLKVLLTWENIVNKNE